MTDTWRPTPFKTRQLYRTLKAFNSLRDSFQSGEVLEFVSSSYSRYDSSTGFVFKDNGSGELRIFDLHDEEPDSLCNEYFTIHKIG
jgi:hypothetical protein